MKKIYNTATMLAVTMKNENMIAESLGYGVDGCGMDADVKEYADTNGGTSTGGKSIWDNEW